MRDSDQTIIKFEYDKNFSNEDFYLSKSNKHVFDFLNMWPKWEKNFVNVSGEKLSGKTHLVMTAVTIGIMTEEEAKFHTISVSSRVEFAELTASDCKEYCDTGEPFDKAGGYGIQGFGSAFIRKINGSYSNIVGLPIHEVVQLLKELGIPYWSK